MRTWGMSILIRIHSIKGNKKSDDEILSINIVLKTSTFREKLNKARIKSHQI